jgi:hypothetical protein
LQAQQSTDCCQFTSNRLDIYVFICIASVMVQGEIDEREFLLTDFGALASPRMLPGASIYMPATVLGSLAGARSVPVKAEHANGTSHAAVAAAGADSTSDGPSAMSVELPQHLSPLAALAAAAAAAPRIQKPPLVPGSLNRRGGLILQGLQSPLPMMNLGPPGPQTPITQAMGSVSWLRGLARGLTVEPSTALQRYMEAAGAEAGPVLVERVKAAAEAVFMSDAGGDPMMCVGLQGLQHGLAQERQSEVGPNQVLGKHRVTAGRLLNQMSAVQSLYDLLCTTEHHKQSVCTTCQPPPMPSSFHHLCQVGCPVATVLLRVGLALVLLPLLLCG